MISILAKLIGPALILYYVYYLEQEKCKCIMTWHHNYIKYYLSAFIVLIVCAITINLDKIIESLFSEETAVGFRLIPKSFLVMQNNKISLIGLLLLLVVIITNIIYLYSVYVYVGELDKTQCGCAMHDMKYLHNTLYYFRYIMIALAIIAVIPVFFIISELVKKLM